MYPPDIIRWKSVTKLPIPSAVVTVACLNIQFPRGLRWGMAKVCAIAVYGKREKTFAVNIKVYFGVKRFINFVI